MNSNFTILLKKSMNLIIAFVYHGMHNIKNSHQVDNNNQQLTIVGIHAKIEKYVCV